MLRLALLVCLLLGVAAPAAHAATTVAFNAASAVNAADVTITGDATDEDVTVVQVSDGYLVSRANGGLATAAPCSAAAGVVKCPLAPSLSVDLAAGNDTLSTLGVSTPMQIAGGTGNDQLSGGAGADVLAGGAGDDTLTGDSSANLLDGGAGKDIIDGGAGDDTLAGGSGNDAVDGGAGNDAADGGDGDDRVTGGSGADDLHGGAGADTLRGRDGTVDNLDCGGDADVVDADDNDTVSGCESGAPVLPPVPTKPLTVPFSFIFGSVKLPDQPVALQHGHVTLNISCPAATPSGRCAGVISLERFAKKSKKAHSSRRTRRFRVADQAYSVKAGKKAKVRVRISSLGRRAINRNGSLKVKVYLRRTKRAKKATKIGTLKVHASRRTKRRHVKTAA